MSLWKPFRGTVEELNATIEKHDGYVYFCTDDGSLFFDFDDGSGNIQRKQITVKEAETIMGHPITKFLDTSTVAKKAEIPTAKAVANFVKGKVDPLDERLTVLEEKHEYDKTSYTLQYQQFTDGTFTVIGVIGNYEHKDIVIPEKYNGMYVGGIAPYAFEGLQISSIKIPTWVRRFGEGAFKGCTSLKSVKIDDLANWLEITWPDEYSNPLYYATNFYVKNTQGTYQEFTTYKGDKDNVISEVLREHVFGRYNKIEHVDLSHTTYIGANVFKYCTNLKSVAVNSVERWQQINFSNEYANPLCQTGQLIIGEPILNEDGTVDTSNSLKSIEITVSTDNPIKQYVFYNCQSLTEVTLAGGYAEGTVDTPIGRSAFKNCVNVDTFNYNIINYHDSSKAAQNNHSVNNFDADNSIFTNLGANNKLLKLIVGVDVTRIPNYLLHGNTSLNEIKFLSNLTEIGAAAFMNCENLTTVNIPTDITSIGYSAFNGCKKLRDIILPKNLTTISDTLFYECAELVYIKIPGTVSSIGAGAFRFCTALRKIDFEDSGNLKTINYLAFGNCTKLIEINIPSSVKTIGKSILHNTYALKEVSLPCLGGHISKWFIPFGMSNTNSNYIPVGLTVEVKGTNIPASYFADCYNISKLIISNTVTNSEAGAISGSNNFIIYCEANSQPIGWNTDWNMSDCKVIWGFNGIVYSEVPAFKSYSTYASFYESGCYEYYCMMIPSYGANEQGRAISGVVIFDREALVGIQKDIQYETHTLKSDSYTHGNLSITLNNEFISFHLNKDQEFEGDTIFKIRKIRDI